MFRVFLKLLLLLAVVASLVLYLQGRELRYPAGILVAAGPTQQPIPVRALTSRRGYKLEAVAQYEITGRVLATKRYRLGNAAHLIPIDVALGWGPMSDQAVLDQLKISQARRFFVYTWDTPEPPVHRSEIERHAANIHVVAATDSVAAKVSLMRVGELVRMKGFLINATGPDGELWRSSLTRHDTGRGACEVFLVEECEPASTPESDPSAIPPPLVVHHEG